jgi:hypothetical protein
VIGTLKGCWGMLHAGVHLKCSLQPHPQPEHLQSLTCGVRGTFAMAFYDYNG